MERTPAGVGDLSVRGRPGGAPFRWLRAAFKYGVPGILLVLVAAATGDSLSRWPVADAALKQFPGQHAILVGFGEHVSGSRNDERHASYILLPSAGTPPRVVTVSQLSDGRVQVEIEQPGYFGFILSIAMTLSMIVICIRIWLTPA